MATTILFPQFLSQVLSYGFALGDTHIDPRPGIAELIRSEPLMMDCPRNPGPANSSPASCSTLWGTPAPFRKAPKDQSPKGIAAAGRGRPGGPSEDPLARAQRLFGEERYQESFAALDEAERLFERNGTTFQLFRARFQRAMNHSNLGMSFLSKTLFQTLETDLRTALVRLQLKQASPPIDVRAGLEDATRELGAVEMILQHIQCPYLPKDGTDWPALFTLIADFPAAIGEETSGRILDWCDRMELLIPKEFVLAQLAVPLLKARVLLRDDQFHEVSSTLQKMTAYIGSRQGRGLSKSSEAMAQSLMMMASGLEGILAADLELNLRDEAPKGSLN